MLNKLRDSVKNLSSVTITYNLHESDTNMMPNTLVVKMGFKMKNSIEYPMADNTFECIVELTLGAIHLLGVKFTENGRFEFVERSGEISKSAAKKLGKLVTYVSGDRLKVSSIT